MDNKLKKVTISGADDRTSIASLIRLSDKYPFVEWGILASPNNHGTDRYPSMTWINDFSTVPVNKSIHLCGKYARLFAIKPKEEELVESEIKSVHDLISGFDRVQINLAPMLSQIDAIFLARNLRIVNVDGILQMPSADIPSVQLLISINSKLLSSDIRIYPFLDRSGGRGTVNHDWSFDISTNNYKGLAGGINQDNVVPIIHYINTANHQGSEFWIDMESGVRTDNELNLKIVERVLESCEPYVMA